MYILPLGHVNHMPTFPPPGSVPPKHPLSIPSGEWTQGLNHNPSLALLVLPVNCPLPPSFRPALLSLLTSEAGPLSAPGQEKVTNSWHLLWTTKQQTATRKVRMQVNRGLVAKGEVVFSLA